MTFSVERCWAGSSRHYFRVRPVSAKAGRVQPFNVGHNRDGDRWDRRAAREALDYLTYFFGLRRRNIRFHVT